jgi:hypothetical protein
MTYTILRIGKKPYFYTYTINLKSYIRMMNIELSRGTYSTQGINDQYDGTPMTYKIIGECETKREAIAMQMELAGKDKKCFNYCNRASFESGVQRPYKLSPSKVRKIRNLCATSGYSVRKIGTLFGVSHVTVVRVKTGESYGYVD